MFRETNTELTRPYDLSYRFFKVVAAAEGLQIQPGEVRDRSYSKWDVPTREQLEESLT